jgi:hypothetical protein
MNFWEMKVINNFLSDQAECPTDKGLGLKRRRYFVLNLHFASPENIF